MAQFLGANVEELRDLSRFFDQHGQQLETIGSRITTSIAKSTWVGADQEGFTSDWQSRLRPQITRASAALNAASRLLESNAREQELASGDGGGGAGGGSSPGAAGGNEPDPDVDPLNPPSDGMGQDEDFTEVIEFDDTRSLYKDEDGVWRWRVDIKQGALGDCWFIASAGAIALHDPQWIEDHARYNEDDNTYTVTFYDEDGNPVEVTIDASAPDLAAGGQNGEPNWLTVYEKAAASYLGGTYEDLDFDVPSRALAALTGLPVRSEGELSFDEIQDRLADGPVTLTTERTEHGKSWFFGWETGDIVDDNRIVPEHIYMVGGFREVDGETQILVVNPWGQNGGIAGDDGQPRLEEVWLTEDEYRENFSHVTSVEMD